MVEWIQKPPGEYEPLNVILVFLHASSIDLSIYWLDIAIHVLKAINILELLVEIREWEMSYAGYCSLFWYFQYIDTWIMLCSLLRQEKEAIKKQQHISSSHFPITCIFSCSLWCFWVWACKFTKRNKINFYYLWWCLITFLEYLKINCDHWIVKCGRFSHI